jgi:hypothetical protein
MLKKIFHMTLLGILVAMLGGIAWAAEAINKPTISTGTEVKAGAPSDNPGFGGAVPGQGTGRNAGPRGVHGLQNALERVTANGATAAQRVLEKLIAADGDVAAIARTLGEVSKADAEKLDKQTKKDLEEVSKELREKVREKQGASVEEKKASLKGIARFFNSANASEEALNTYEAIVELKPDDLDSYKEIGKIYKGKGIADIATFVNGKKPKFDVKPRVENGRTLVPFRALGEALGAAVAWHPEKNTVSFTKGDRLVELTIGEKTAYVNGVQHILEVPAFVENGRTVVPLRFISEALKTKVEWLPDARIIVVYE